MAFSGVAVYDIFSTEVGEDVSKIVSMISPAQTKFLDDIGDADESIKSKLYSWEQKTLLPDSYTTSSAIASSAGTSNGIEIGANAAYLKIGDILAKESGTGEQMYITSVGTSSATIYVTRAYAGTTANSAAAGTQLMFLGSALYEGAEIREQRRTIRVNKFNFVQTFREDINISNLANKVVMKVSGKPEPFDEEVVDKTTEAMKQLEKACLMGRTNGNTIGADDKETTMAGIYHSITTNIVSHATFSNSILNNVMASINTYTDLESNIDKYALYAGVTAFRKISNSRDSRIQQTIQETVVGVQPAETYLSDFGRLAIRQIRWIPSGTVLCLRKDFIKIAPYIGNSFGSKPYDDGSLAKKGYVAGTYGMEFKEETAHGRLDGIA